MSNPYWAPPEREGPNMEFVRAKVEEVGGPALLFWLAKSHNRNTLMFLWDGDASKVVPRWLILEDTHRRKYLSTEAYARGDPCTRPLTENEVPFMGCETNPLEDGSIQVIFNALEDSSDAERMRCNLVADAEGSLGLVGRTKDGKMCRVDCGYIQCKRGLLMDAEYISIHSRLFETGETVIERITSS